MRAWLAGLAAWLLAGAAAAGPIDKLTFYTENLPPYQFKQDGKLTGLMVDLVAAMFAVAETDKTVSDIRMVPWARGYKEAKTIPNTVLFGIIRTPQREDLFTWIGPALPYNTVVLAHREAPAIDTLTDLNAHHTATVRDDVAEQLLLKAGVQKDQLIRKAKPGGILPVLKRGRAQYWAYQEATAFHLLKQAGLAAQYETAYTLKTGDNWLAANPDTDPAAIAALQTALDKLKAQGKIAQIRQRYR